MMKYLSVMTSLKLLLLVAVVTSASPGSLNASDNERLDYLSIEQGAFPVALGDAARELKVGMDKALLTIDGDTRPFVLTPKPGASNTQVTLTYQLPALTTFTDFSVSNILETPSPSQTFFKSIVISGSTQGPDGPFRVLARASLETHANKGQTTSFPATTTLPVKWARLALKGGTDIQRDLSFFEFSEIVGHGEQEPIPLLEKFTGKWKDRGVLMELTQDGERVHGCFDGEGTLAGTVVGNLLRATGKTTRDIPSIFVLTVTDDGEVFGVRSTNGAPFRLYTGKAAPNIETTCSKPAVDSLGCGSVIHGINFDFDSATIRPESYPLLDDLSAGLKTATSSRISVVGHTSSEGTDEYNEKLSQRRAKAVVAALVKRGHDPAMISSEGRGEKQPIADNATGAGRSLNRRVEIECTDTSNP